VLRLFKLVLLIFLVIFLIFLATQISTEVLEPEFVFAGKSKAFQISAYPYCDFYTRETKYVILIKNNMTAWYKVLLDKSTMGNVSEAMPNWFLIAPNETKEFFGVVLPDQGLQLLMLNADSTDLFATSAMALDLLARGFLNTELSSDFNASTFLILEEIASELKEILESLESAAKEQDIASIGQALLEILKLIEPFGEFVDIDFFDQFTELVEKLDKVISLCLGSIDAPNQDELVLSAIRKQKDVKLILRHIVGLEELTADQLRAADISSNGRVTAYDAHLMLKY